MAIALLTDAGGRISLAIPVRGDLGNPEFDFGKIVSLAIGNAIGKIVTPPFLLLAEPASARGDMKEGVPAGLSLSAP